MLKIVFAMMAVAIAGSNASATTVYCTQTEASKAGYLERFVFQLNRDFEITAQDEQIRNLKKGQKFDNPRLANEDKPLRPKKSKDTLKYHYKYQDEGDGDYPGPKEDHYITLPKSLKGPAHVTVVYDKGDSGQDDYDLVCE